MRILSGVGLLAVITMAAPTAVRAQDLNGDQIIEKITDGTFTIKKGKAKMSMVINRGGGKVDKRTMETKIARIDGLRRTRTDFSEPADVKGTVLLQLEKKGDQDVQHLFLPSLRRTRQISGSNKNSSFVGSDFTYADMEYRDLKSGKREKLADEKVDGVDCYHMVVLPEQDGNNEYSKVNLWADKAHLLPLKMELFDKAGKLLKVFEGKKVEQHEDSWILAYTKMTNVQKGSNTEIAVTDVNSGAVIPPSEFSPQALDK